MDDAVTIGYVHNGLEVAYSWHKCFVEIVGYDMLHGGHVIRGGWAATQFSHNIVDARNQAIRGWLDDEDRADVDWFFWIDTDMGYQPDTVEQLLKVADPKLRPIVGGLAFSNMDVGDDGFGGHRTEPRPTMFKWVPEKGTVCVADYPVNSLVDVAATGSACILIHRSVFETIRDEEGDDAWYQRIWNPYEEGLMGEDISFCLRAAKHGFPTFVHTGVRTTHLKEFWLSEVDYWQYRPAPPALEATTIIVPVLNRPQNAKPFMETLRASTGMAEVIAVCNDDNRDDIDAWKETGAQVYAEYRIDSFAQKINAALLLADTPWIFICGDDVRFHPGWLDHAQHVGNLQNVGVVGTNDLGNPRVMAGEHATHLLIRRSYIDDVGASWDGPGIVCHEGYRHWYVDDEIVTAAKLRGQWAMALGSFVEHLHPIWEKGENDATYELGQSFAKKDAEHYKNRHRRYAQGPKR